MSNRAPQFDEAVFVKQLQDINESISRAEREIKVMKTQELASAYNSHLAAQEYAKREELALRQHEYERMLEARKALEDEQARKRYERTTIKNNLADNYSLQIEAKRRVEAEKRQREVEEEAQRLEVARRSLELENLRKKEKLDNFNREAQSLLQEREYQRRLKKEEEQRAREETRNLQDQTAQAQMAKEAGYRNYFRQVDENQRALQQIHSEKVFTAALDKDRAIDDHIRRGQDEYNRRIAEEEYAKAKKRYDEKQNAAAILREQIRQKEEEKERQRMQHFSNVEDSVRRSQEYNDYMRGLKTDKVERQKLYKDILDVQKNEKTKLDPVTSPANGNVPLMIPGVSNSKYIHPYSPEARYADVLNFKMRAGYPPQMPTEESNRNLTGNQGNRSLNESRSSYLATIANNNIFK
eukprot:TRINITY_DN9641_c0_g1_i10.p1 TRINITY_DN9641_c0_g1~~TRINITY_DN9641_c0_g1_i10.p1  ORF type:complete len:411 (+),score=113.15 TRINITY_DN9641_c0_g1_i10:27-1259(+)